MFTFYDPLKRALQIGADRIALIDEDADGNLDREREAREAQGAFDIVIDQRRTFAVALPDAAPPPIAAGPALSEAEALPGVAGRQFRAADDASVLASVAEPDAALATVYRWSIHARADGKALGTLRSPYSYAPFIVRGSLLIYRAEPVLTQRGETSLALGSRLVAFDLETGVERWSVPVRDAQFLGPIPP